MPLTDTREKGLETLIMLHMTGTDGLAPVAEGTIAETPDAFAAAKAAGSGWLAGNSKDYDRSHALDVPQLFQFLQATQPDTVKKLGMADYKDAKDINRQKFLSRLERKIELLREYRTRLVADVVTGKLDVRPAAAKLPDTEVEPTGTAEEEALREATEIEAVETE